MCGRRRTSGLAALVMCLFLSGFMVPGVSAEAVWVWHGGIREPVHPGRDDTVTVWVKIGYQYYVDHAVLYVTTDGTEPQGAFGVASGSAGSISMTWDHLEWDSGAGMYADWWRGAISAREIGTRVRYKIGVWHSGGGQERFADNNASTSTEADCFEYVVKGSVRQVRSGHAVTVAARIAVPGVTDPPGPTPGLEVELWTDYTDTGPADWHGVSMTYTEDDGSADIYHIGIQPACPGVYSYLVRFRLNAGPWVYQGDPGDWRSMNRINVDPSWMEDGVLYQVFPRVHNAVDTDGDGDLSNDEFGGFGEVMADISRIASLGFGALWLMPIHPLSTDPALIKSSDGLFGSPYSPKNYLGVNPDYGSETELHALVNAAHQAGLKVLIGFVPNHLSPDNVLLDPSNPESQGGYHPDWFMTDGEGNPIPDDPDWWDTVALNYECGDAEQMRGFVTDAMAYWLETFGIDGFRCDMASLQPVDFWEDTLVELKTGFPECVFIAEAYNMDYELERAGFSAVYDYTLYRSLYDEVRTGAIDAADLAYRLETAAAGHVWGRLPLLYVENHDEERAAAAFGAAADELNRLILCLKGTPVFYGGQEAGLDRRVPLYRGWNGVETYPFIDFHADPAHTARLQACIAYRNGSDALRKGDQIFPACSNRHVFPVARRFGEERVLAAFNLDISGGQRQGGIVILPGTWDLDAGTTYRFSDIDGSGERRVRGGPDASIFLDLPPTACVIYQVEEACSWGGDTNGNGVADDEDDRLILQSAAGLFELTGDEDCRGDLNLSGTADIVDVVLRRNPSGPPGEPVTAILDSVYGMPGGTAEVSLRIRSGSAAGACLNIRTDPPLSPISWVPGTDLTQTTGASGIDPCPPGRECTPPETGVFTSAQVTDTGAGAGSEWIRVKWSIPDDAVWGTVHEVSCSGTWVSSDGRVLSGSTHISGRITIGYPCSETGVTLYMPDTYLTPGDVCRLDAAVCNSGPDLESIPFCCLLCIENAFWYYPSWSATPDCRIMDVPGGTTIVSVIPPFTWPDVEDAMNGLLFVSALITPDGTDIIGTIGRVYFDYAPDGKY